MIVPGAGLPDPAEEWRPLELPDPARWIHARLQLHHALQVVAAAGGALLEAEPDDGHRAAVWAPELGAFVSRPLPVSGAPDGSQGDAAALRGPPVQLAVRPFPLELQLRAPGRIHRYALPGHGLDEAFRWVERELGHLVHRPGLALERPEFRIPEHPVGAGALFDASPRVLESLAAWYHDAWIVLSEVARQHPEASAPRIWPHHFDVATRLELSPGESGGGVINVGMSPGDPGHDLPCWYFSPWPAPDAPALPALTHGGWETEGWLGACLPARTLLDPGGEAAPGGTAADAAHLRRHADVIHAFLGEALPAARSLLPA